MQDLFVKKIKLKELDERNKYPYKIPLIANFTELEITKPVTFIVGENGSGKSTLLEAVAIALGLNPEGGSQNFNFSSYDSHSELYKYIALEKGFRRPVTKYFLRAESFYNVASETQKNPAALYFGMKGISLHESSHGESFINLIENRFYNNGLYLMDEPEAGVSPTRQMEMMILIDNLVKGGSQFIICTHSPILLSYPNATIYQINDGVLEKIQYRDTEIFNLYEGFINNSEAYLHRLLND